MRTQAIEKLASLMASAIEQDNVQAAKQYATKFRIVADRDNNTSASVLKEIMNS